MSTLAAAPQLGNSQRIAIHHILLRSALLADDVMRELKLGSHFEGLAAEYSACPSGKNQGFCGYHDTRELPIELLEALNNAKDGDTYLGPIKTSLGYHIIKAVELPSITRLLNTETIQPVAVADEQGLADVDGKAIAGVEIKEVVSERVSEVNSHDITEVAAVKEAADTSNTAANNSKDVEH